jgi:hypothetical protein
MTDLLKELTHYICWRTDDPTKLGATKLNKALWFSDTIAYRMSGRSITGTPYVKRQFGPAPKRILSVLDDLAKEGKIAIRQRQRFNYLQREFVALTPASGTAFSEEDRDIIDQVVAWVCNEHTASSISELSHDGIWEAAEEGEEIPMFAVLGAAEGELTDTDRIWADSVIAGRK